MKTPVALLIFNRPETTKRVFEEIRRAKPPVLLIVADGPRKNHPNEAGQCAAARAIIEQVDWNCEILKNYSEHNLGCKKRVSSGLDWVFNLVEEAIVLEDDCLPHFSFFQFCEELLNKYRDDSRIMNISGDNFQPWRKNRSPYSYYFSHYFYCWGWASWRRAWKHYDVDMKLWPQIQNSNWLQDVLHKSRSVKYFTKVLQDVYSGHVNTWDYQWMFACWIQSGLSILPNVNLISNIGFGEQATHTQSNSELANLPLNSMNFPLSHPPFVIRDVQADDYDQGNIFSVSLTKRIRSKINRFKSKLVS
jgi:hypothetical protein